MGNSGGLQTNPLPKAGSAMGLDQLAQAFVLQELETLQGGDSTTSLGPSSTAQLSSWGKNFP